MKTHGDSNERFYHIWKHIKSRCNCKTNKKYHRYGGRGIKNLWSSYEDFKKDMHPSYLIAYKKHKNISIERTDNNGHYCKENCRWATPIEQANNQSTNRVITLSGKSLTASQWSRKLNIPLKTINSRIHILKLKNSEAILAQPQPKYIYIKHNGENKSVSEWAKEKGVNRITVYNRIRRGVKDFNLLFSTEKI